MKQNFIEAKKMYQATTAYLKTISNGLHDLFNSTGKVFDRQLFLNQYDSLLQFSLLEVAISDNFLDIEELEFIRDLTDNADFIVYINKKFSTNIKWQTILNSNEQQIADFLLDIRPAMNVLKDDFSKCFALYDHLDKKYDCLDLLRKSTAALLWRISNEDGETTDWEITAAKHSMILDTLKEIQININYLSNMENDALKSTDASTTNSLKSIYNNKLKKN